jgi:hypothetical protein
MLGSPKVLLMAKTVRDWLARPGLNILFIEPGTPGRLDRVVQHERITHPCHLSSQANKQKCLR